MAWEIIERRAVPVSRLEAVLYSVAVLHRRINALLRVPSAIVYAKRYVGPDRRQLAIADPRRAERRRDGLPDRLNYVLSVSDILRSFLTVETPTPEKPEERSGRGCRAQDLQPGQQLAESCISAVGVVVVAAKGVLTERSIQGIVDMISSGDLTDRFVVVE